MTGDFSNMLKFKRRHFKKEIILMFVGWYVAYSLAGIELHHMLRKGQHKQSANLSLFDQFYQLAAHSLA